MTDSAEAERVCLGACLIEGALVEQLGELKPEHFGDLFNRQVFVAMMALSARSERVDAVTVRAELELTSGDSARLAEMMDLPRMTGLEDWIRIVREGARKRALSSLALRVGEWLDEADSAAVIDRLQQALTKIQQDGDARSYVVTVDQFVKLGLEYCDRLTTSLDGVVGVPCGIRDVDEHLGGFQPGRIYTLGARPGRGKSAFATQTAYFAGMTGHHVLMFSLEMPPEQVALRMLLSAANAELWSLRARDMDQWARMTQASVSMRENIRLEVNKHEQPTLAQIKAHATRLKREGRLDLLVVDYFQRCSVRSATGVNRFEALTEMIRGLKSLALSLEIPILLPAQLKRDAQERRPILSDLKEAGSIEEESDVVMFLHPQPSKEGKSPDEVMKQDAAPMGLIIDKNRHGAERLIPLTFERKFVRFAKGEEFGEF